MGSIARMDPKPTSSCGYLSKPPPQPIAQNCVFKSERPGTPLGLKIVITLAKLYKNELKLSTIITTNQIV